MKPKKIGEWLGVGLGVAFVIFVIAVVVKLIAMMFNIG